ncbi:bifunctional DNA primase/polymerase [Patescibacteria group bacterium]|nr:bifunctional DNA primase/polymerase [Patescibacteria group bacterium]
MNNETKTPSEQTVGSPINSAPVEQPKHAVQAVEAQQANAMNHRDDSAYGNGSLEHALLYLSHGWSTIPIGLDSISKGWKKPLIKWQPYQTNLPTEQDLHNWWKLWPDARVGIVTGKLSGIIVVDIDPRHGGSIDNIDLPPTLISKTGGGGWHYYYKHPKNQVIPNASNSPRKGIDIRGDGGFVVAPPSLHASGEQYEWSLGLDTELIAPCPDWLAEAGNAQNKKPLLELLDGVSEGGRNDSATRVVGLIFSRLETEEFDTLGWDEFVEWNEQNSPPMSEKELRTIFESIKIRELTGRKDENTQAQKKRSGGKFFRDFLKKYEVSFFRDAKRDGFVRIKVGDSSKLISSTSPELGDLYRDLFFEVTGVPLTDNKVKEAMSQLSAHARRKGELIKPCLRVAKEGEAYYYDLANEAGECVKIDAKGWQIMANTDIPLITNRLTAEQCRPEMGGDINDIFRFINVKDEDDRLLLIAALTACFISDIPHPALIIHGPKGAAKTSAMALIKILVDPSEVTSVHLTKDLRDLAVNFNSSWLVPFDNVSSINQEVSDALSKVVTGDSFSVRKLYENTDLSVMTFQRCLVINGINNPVKTPDLLDRSVLIEIERIEDSVRKSDAELRKERLSLLPKILGALFDTMSKALAALPDVPRDNLARLADFDLWGRSVSVALFGDAEPFMKAYAKNVSRQSKEAVEQSPLAVVLMRLLREIIQEGERLETTATKLFHLLRSTSSTQKDWEDEFPKSANWLSQKLNIISSDLGHFGFHITRRRNTGGERLLIIERIKTKHDEPESSANTQEESPKILSPKEISSLLPSSSVADGIDATDSKK